MDGRRDGRKSAELNPVLRARLAARHDAMEQWLEAELLLREVGIGLGSGALRHRRSDTPEAATVGSMGGDDARLEMKGRQRVA